MQAAACKRKKWKEWMWGVLSDISVYSFSSFRGTWTSTTNRLSRSPQCSVLSTPSCKKRHDNAKPPGQRASTRPVTFFSSPLRHPDTLNSLGLYQLRTHSAQSSPSYPRSHMGRSGANGSLEDREPNQEGS